MISNMFQVSWTLWPSSPPGLKLGSIMPSGQPHRRRTHEFLGFLVAAGFQLGQVNNIVPLAFMEYLVLNNISPATISNYLAGI